MKYIGLENVAVAAMEGHDAPFRQIVQKEENLKTTPEGLNKHIVVIRKKGLNAYYYLLKFIPSGCAKEFMGNEHI